ncbi:MAG: helix-turn-helix domain-containing protein [Burkholderiales bacterium]
MDYPIQSAGQLSAHLRSLRKSRGLNQVQLGAVLGVGQTRIARIERDPAAVSVEQFLALLGALGVQMVLRPNGPGQVAEAPAGASGAASTPPAPARRRPPGEPW